MNNPVYTVAKDNDGKSIWRFLLRELMPKGKWLTPFNVISIPVMILGLTLIVIRFWKGIGSITNLTQEVPWGLWIGFDVVTGVAFAGGRLRNYFYGLYPEHKQVSFYCQDNRFKWISGVCFLRRCFAPRSGAPLECD